MIGLRCSVVSDNFSKIAIDGTHGRGVQLVPQFVIYYCKWCWLSKKKDH